MTRETVGPGSARTRPLGQLVELNHGTLILHLLPTSNITQLPLGMADVATGYGVLTMHIFQGLILAVYAALLACGRAGGKTIESH